MDYSAHRIGAALAVRREELGLSISYVSRLTQLNRRRISKIENGFPIAKFVRTVNDLNDFYNEHSGELVDIFKLSNSEFYDDVYERAEPKYIDFNDVRKKVADYMEFEGLSIEELGDQSNIKYKTLTAFLNGETQQLSAENFVRLIIGMDSFLEYFIDANAFSTE